MAIFLAALPWALGAAGVAALSGTAGYAAGGGVKGASELIKVGLLAGTAVGAVYVYKKL